jgi:hypothetical protein
MTEFSSLTDPADRVVAEAAVLRERYPTLTRDQARYVAHCIVRHGALLGAGAGLNLGDWHTNIHARGVDTHTHASTAWPA